MPSSLPLVVHPRISERHPEISEDDVRAAWEHAYLSACRPGESVWVVLGHDMRGREVEILIDVRPACLVAFHAMTPPTRKIRSELDRILRRTR
ncbi:hypothetical protein [Actinomyces faecalis]|uniref:hypothetical protein n=1 Tax=Actinomyces faecalis TaxID=2722820 RepID=UPI001C5556FA|nr:hypothetical protein [Actinomyces faecalis]